MTDSSSLHLAGLGDGIRKRRTLKTGYVSIFYEDAEQVMFGWILQPVALQLMKEFWKVVCDRLCFLVKTSDDDLYSSYMVRLVYCPDFDGANYHPVLVLNFSSVNTETVLCTP